MNEPITAPDTVGRTSRARTIATGLRDFARLLYRRFTLTRCPQVAGSLTYTTLLAIVPLLTVSIVLFSNFPAFSQLGGALSNFLQDNVLPEAAGQITEYALQFSSKATNLTLIGTAMLVVTVLLLLNTIDDVFNDIWGVRHPRPLLTRVMIYWVALTLGPFALAGSIFATSQIVATSVEWIGESQPVRTVTADVVPLVLLGTLFSFLYFAIPNHPVRLLHAMAGGFPAAFAFLSMQRLFGLFIAMSPSYTLVYGTFAALPIFLLWLYLSWTIVLLGAIFAATFPEFFERKRAARNFPGDRALAALNVLTELTTALRIGRTTPFTTLHERAAGTQDETENLLGEMTEAGWVARTEDECWVLTRHPDTLALAEIVQRFALSTEDWTNASGSGEVGALAAECIHEGLCASDLSLSTLTTRAEARAATDQIG